jgi:hypothetical protein
MVKRKFVTRLGRPMTAVHVGRQFWKDGGTVEGLKLGKRDGVLRSRKSLSFGSLEEGTV